MTSRRGFLMGLGAALAAPAIVRAELIMPVRSLVKPAAPSIGDIVSKTMAGLEPWLPCDGRALSRAVYAELFQVIGTTYGAPDADTFNLPAMPQTIMKGPYPDSPSVALGPIIRAASGDIAPAGMLVLTCSPPTVHFSSSPHPHAFAAPPMPAPPHDSPAGFPLIPRE